MQLNPCYYITRSVYIKPKKKYIYNAQDVIDDIYLIIHRIFGITKTEVISKNRKRELVLARQIAAILMYKYTNYTSKTIGLELGGRDHSTILYSFGQINDLLSYDKILRNQYNDCKIYLSSKHIEKQKENRCILKNL